MKAQAAIPRSDRHPHIGRTGLGGWVARKDNRPGKIVLACGLRRLLDMLVTQQVLANYEAEHGALPPRIAAWLGRQPPNL